MNVFHMKRYATIKHSMETENAETSEKTSAVQARGKMKERRFKAGDEIHCKTKESMAKHADDLCNDGYVLSVNMETYVITIKADTKKPE